MPDGSATELSPPPARSHGGGWLTALIALAAGLLIIALFLPTAESMVAIWTRSETFAHGFLIVPISLWLVWDQRQRLTGLAPAPAYRVLWLSVPLGVGWLLGNLVDVLVVQQFAFVGLLVAGLWALLGHRLARALAFPLGFLFFAVPVGEALIPPMMDFTADFTVAMLRLTGIPVFREGTFFTIPSGSWSVVEGCSGVRYLIASVTLGVLYAYLTYHKLWKRLLFIGFSVVVPVIANGLRAYMIVMIAHLSDMKLALGVDHFIYGWVFFGLVVTLMFAIGALWRDPPPPLAAPQGMASAPGRGHVLTALLVVPLAMAVWPLTAQYLHHETLGPEAQVTLEAPARAAGWTQLADSQWTWRPEILNPDAESYQFFGKDGQTVGLYLGLYVRQRQDAELVNSQNLMVRQKHPEWASKGSGRLEIELDGRPVTVQWTRLMASQRRLLVWHWYRLGGHHLSNPYVAKLLEAGSRLLGSRRDAAMIVVTAPYEERPEEAEPVLRAFLADLLPGMEQTLDKAAGLR